MSNRQVKVKRVLQGEQKNMQIKYWQKRDDAKMCRHKTSLKRSRKKLTLPCSLLSYSKTPAQRKRNKSKSSLSLTLSLSLFLLLLLLPHLAAFEFAQS